MSAENRIDKIVEYAENKFKKNGLVYLTEAAHMKSLEDTGENTNRGPYVITGTGRVGIEFFMSVRDINMRPWRTEAYIEDDEDIEDWLTEEEYFIEQTRVLNRETFIHDNVNTVSDSELETLNKFFKAPELWVPEVEDAVAVYCDPYPALKKLRINSSDTFCECQVEAVDYDSVFDVRGLPRLIVEVVGHGGGGYGSVKGISPLHCY